MSEQSKQIRKLALKSPSKAVAELLLEFADYMESANLKRKELDDIIEQQQQRIAELEARNNELATTVEGLIKTGNELLEAIDTHLEAIKRLEQ